MFRGYPVAERVEEVNTGWSGTASIVQDALL